MIILLGTCMSQFSYNFDSSKFLVPGLYRSKLFLSCLSFCQYCILNSSNNPWGCPHNCLHHKLAYSCSCSYHPLTRSGVQLWNEQHLKNICTGLVFREIPQIFNYLQICEIWLFTFQWWIWSRFSFIFPWGGINQHNIIFSMLVSRNNREEDRDDCALRGGVAWEGGGRIIGL